MKEILAFVIAILMIVPVMLTSCGGGEPAKENSTDVPSADQAQSENSGDLDVPKTDVVAEVPQYNGNSYLRSLFSMKDIENGDVIFPILNGYVRGSEYHIIYFGSDVQQSNIDVSEIGLTERFRFMGKDMAKDSSGKLHLLEVINIDYSSNLLSFGKAIDPELLLGDDRVILFFDSNACCYVDKSDFKIYYQDYADESGKGSDPVLLVQPEVYYLKMKSSNYDLDLEENDSSPIVSVEYADKESKDIVIFRTEDGNAYYYSGNAYFDKAGYNRTYSENAKNYVSRMARIGIKRGSWINRGKWTSMSQDDFRALIGSESSKIYLRLETREEDAEKFIIKDPDGKGVLLHSIEEYCKNVVFRNGNYPGDYSDDTVGFYDTDDTVLYINSADSYEGEYTRVELPDGKKISDIDWSRTFSYTTDLLITFKNGKSYVRSGGALEYNEEISGFAGHIKKTYRTGAGGFAVLMDDGYYYLFNY